MDAFKLPCPCGDHAFVFGEKPHQPVEVKCPVCEKVTAFDPTKKTKESDK